MNSTKKTVTIDRIAKLLMSKNSVALFAHTNPDGDTLGATVALGVALRKLGKTVAMFCDSPIDEKLRTEFPETAEISTEFDGSFDLLAAIDCGDVNRLGKFAERYDRFSETLTVDHHGGEYYSKYNLVSSRASTCQIIYDIVRLLPIAIDPVIATYLYMGLCTDTGNFSHNNTDKDCFLTAAELCEKGANTEKVNRVFFKDTTLAETKLLGCAIGNLRTYFDGKMVLMYLTKADLAEFNADLSATSGIVQNAINVDTAKVGVMLTEYTDNVYKVSMRGKDFPVREICRQFGGGGHLYASGCMISGFLEDVINKIVREVGFSI